MLDPSERKSLMKTKYSGVNQKFYIFTIIFLSKQSFLDLLIELPRFPKLWIHLV